MGDDLSGFIDALGLTAPDAFGWSTGGEIVLMTLVRHPGRLGNAAITGAMPGGPSTVVGPADKIAKLEDPATPSEEVLPLLFGPDASEAQGRFIADYLKEPQTVVAPAATLRYKDCEHAYIDGRSYDDEYRKVQTPLLVFNGEGDQLVPAENAKRIAAVVPEARLALQPGGHAWFIEHPDVFVATLDGFYRS